MQFLSIFSGSATCSNDEFVLERIRFTLSECKDDKTCIVNVSNKWFFFNAVFPCSVYYYILFQRIAANSCHQKNYSATTHFQYLSAKFILFWFWPQPITTHETDIQKWLWVGLLRYLHRQILHIFASFLIVILWITLIFHFIDSIPQFLIRHPDGVNLITP